MPADEFIFGDRETAKLFASEQGWREAGRAAWQKPDGTRVLFITFAEQLAAVTNGERLYVIPPVSLKAMRYLKAAGVKVVKLPPLRS